MKKLLVLCALLSGCAVPVRPVARLVPDADGGAHFEADPEREPHVPAGLIEGGMMILKALGPWGDLAATLLAGAGIAGPAVVVHRHHKKKHKKAAPPKAG